MRHLPWLKDNAYPLLVEPVRALLQETGRPWVIENVEDAPLGGIVLCGLSFGLKVYRHRRFESNVLLLAPPHIPHRDIIASGHGVSRRMAVSPSGMVMVGGHMGGEQFRAAQTAMGISWMNRNELAQAIPPAFTCHVGVQLMAALQHREVA